MEELPEPDAFQRYMAGEELSPEDHVLLQSYLLARVLEEVEHICDNSKMQLGALGDLFEKLDPTVEVEVPE